MKKVNGFTRRDYGLTIGVLVGCSFRTVGEVYGISHTRARQIFNKFLRTYATEEYWGIMRGMDAKKGLPGLRANMDTLMAAINATLDNRPKRPNRFNTALARATVAPDIHKEDDEGTYPELKKPTPALLSIKPDPPHPANKDNLWGRSLVIQRETWERFKAFAETQYRTPEGQILYLIDRALEADAE